MPFGGAFGAGRREQVAQSAHEIGVEPLRIDAEEPSQGRRVLGCDVEGEPGRDGVRRELRRRKIDRDDRGHAFARCAGRCQRLGGLTREAAQQVAHRGLDEVVLAAEIVMGERRGDPARPAISDIVTSSDPRAPMAETAASISALRRNGSIPSFGILEDSSRHPYF